MIARAWRGETLAEDADAYLAYLDGTGVSDCAGSEGNRGVLVLRRTVDDTAEFLFMSFWDSMDAIRGFAGPEPEWARYYEEDRRYLLEMQPTVDHFEVAVRRFPPEVRAPGPDAIG